MRPLLPDDGSCADGKVISSPTSMEAFGRGIDLVQNLASQPRAWRHGEGSSRGILRSHLTRVALSLLRVEF